MIRLALFSTLMACTSVCLAFQSQERTLSLITERLSLMQNVAAYKWHHDLPVEDLVREKVVLNSAMASSLDRGITTTSSRQFFKAQIEAAKDIQRCWIDRWEKGSIPPDAPDLGQITRPALLHLGKAITNSLSAQNWRRRSFDQIVVVDCLSSHSSNGIYAALNGIAFYENRLQQITDSGQLRVGTTGDYAPFSFAEDGEQPTGIDIDLANSLANWLEVEPVFISTSWPNLAADFLAGKYDIAMSGVSIIDARKQFAYFSAPYHVGGKTPIALCTEASKFGSLTDIDQPEVRLIVNPGGTNEKYLDANIRQASKVLHTDNRSIFEQILIGKVDVMITDSIEVKLQTARHDALCPTMAGKTLTRQKKGYMLPKEDQLLKVVNNWLNSIEQNGTLKNVFATHLSR